MTSQIIAGYGYAQADEAGLHKHEIVPPTHVEGLHHSSKISSDEKSSDAKKEKASEDGQIVETVHHENEEEDDGLDYNVTDEDRVNLRRIPAPIPWTAFLIAICELSERFSYYGTTQVFQK